MVSIDNMFAYLEVIRPLNCLMAALAVYIATVIAGGSFYPADIVIYGMASVFLICGAGMIINDYFDTDIDRINKPDRPLPAGRIKKNIALSYSAVLYFNRKFLNLCLRLQTQWMLFLRIGFI